MPYRLSDENSLSTLLYITRRSVQWYVIGLLLVGLVFLLPASVLTMCMFLVGEVLIFLGNIWLIIACAALMLSALPPKWKTLVAVLLIVSAVALPIEYRLFTTP